MLETILCPTDFSPGSENAIRFADELAQHMNTRIVLFHSIPEQAPEEPLADHGVANVAPHRDPGYHQAQKDKLIAIKKSLENVEWGMPVAYEAKVMYGQTKDTIRQAAYEVQADLLVIGTEKAQGLKETFFSSVAAEVIKSAPCPVLVIAPKVVFKPFDTVVFATDLQGEPYSDMVQVTKLASLFDAEIQLLHFLTGESEETRRVAEAELARLQKSLHYPHTSVHIQTRSDIEEGISQFCRQQQAQLLVMGFHPGNYLRHLVAQDTSLEVAYHAHLPLLVLHYHS